MFELLFGVVLVYVFINVFMGFGGGLDNDKNKK